MAKIRFIFKIMSEENTQGNLSDKTGLTTLLDSEIAPYWLSALVESANDAIISKTLEGIITSWNKGAELIFGYTAEEVIGKPILILIPPDHHNEEPAILEKIKSGERVEHFETVRCRKDGSLVDISLTISPIKDASGKIIGASKIARDITLIKQAEEQLRANEERYRTLFNSIDEGFCVIQVIFDEHGKAVDWIFLEINPMFEEQTGIARAEGKTMRQIIPNHDESWFEIYGKVAMTGEPIRFENRAEVLDRWFDLYAFRVGKPENRKVAVLFKDITERKRTEAERERLLKQIEAERSRLTYLFTKAPAFVATLRGADHVFEVTNPSYLQLIGHRDVTGKPAREVLPEMEEQGFFEILDNVFQTGEPFIGREMLIQIQKAPNAPLEQHFVDFVYQPIFEADGSVSGIFVHGVDITEQVQDRKNAEQANRSKDEFLAMLSHELRTPLNAILGWSRMMNEDQLPEDAKKRAVETIQRNVLVQSQLIDDILDVSRITSGKLKLETQPTELAPVIEEAIETAMPAVNAKKIRLEKILDTGSCIISGDPNRLQQIVWNLLANAVKFTPKGGRIQIRLERVNSHVEIIVTDNGIGISPEIMPHIFERFTQADSTTTRRHGGLGLGLAIVRHLVEMHGGMVEAESEGEGRGTTFTVSLPLISLRSIDISPRNGDRVHPTSIRNISFECTPELEGLRVLIVDDEEDGRSLVTMVLQKCGAEVIEADSAESGFKALQEFMPDVLISDLGMPVEDGYSLIRKTRALPADKGGKTPAAALTAYARIEDRMRVLRAGFQMHIPKPVEPAELIAVVANLSGRHRED